MMKHFFSLLFFSFLVFFNTNAQQEMRFTQYMYNLYQVNAAYAGSRNTVNMAAIVRSQWTGIDGAPNLQAITVNAPIRGKNIGLGLKMINQSSGASDVSRLTASFAYRFRLGGGKLAFGLSAGLINNRFNWGKAQFKNEMDQVQFSGVESTYTPGFEYAAYYYTKTWYAGFQFENLNQSQYTTLSTAGSKNYLTYDVIAGKAFPINESLIFKPSVLIQGSQSILLGEINLSLLINEIFWVGLTYRTNSEVSLIIEFNLNQQIRIGYSYDYTFKAIPTYYSGSHEIFVGYDIRFKKRNLASPRYF